MLCDDPTTEFYEVHADEFCDSTAKINMERLYEPFLKLLAQGAHILDAGCGSGRDTKAFRSRGFRVTAIDCSPRVIRFARQFTGQKCQLLRFQDISFHRKFDGIWACASLLHVPKIELPNVIARLDDALKPGGVIYMSLKEGRGERIADDGRFFSYHTATSIRRLLAKFPNLFELSIWTTEDVRGEERRPAWLNVIIRKRKG